MKRKMKKQKFKNRNGRKLHKTTPGRKSGRLLFEYITLGGILLSAAVLLISLSAYFLPRIPEPEKEIMDAVPPLSQAGNPETASQEETDVAHTTGADPVPMEPESIPFLVSSNELGDISDLTMEDSCNEDTSVYLVMLDTSMGPMLYYNQGDARWASYLYGGEDPMGTYGCGPTAVSMLINSFSCDSLGVTPVNLADWAFANGEYAPKGGSYHSLIPNALSGFGLQVESIRDYSRENAADLLATKHILVALMGKGSLTENGHFILITKLLDNGNVHIADPNSYENSTTEWNLEQLLSELKDSRDHGAPLWAVSLPAQGCERRYPPSTGSLPEA